MAFELVSDAFASGADIPARHTGDGDDTSPPLRWTDPPDGTKSLALVVEDPDAPGRTFAHWVLYKISPSRRELPAGIPGDDRVPGVGVHGKNDFANLGYGGPAPPPGSAHRYYFRLYALDEDPNLSGGRGREELLRAIDGHILAQAELMGRYQRS